MFRTRWARLAGALAFSLAACTPAAPTPTATAVVTAPPVVPSTLSPATSTAAPTIVTIWMPPFLAPDVNTQSGLLLDERLAAFETDHPNVKLAVRTKETAGPSGLLETLRAASVVAPASLPDLLALGPGEVSSAAQDELILPFPGPLPAPEETAWYPFALEAAMVGDVRFGVPSAAQTEVLVYDTTEYGRTPTDWAAVVGGPAPFLFPAADPTAAFTLAEYLSSGGLLAQPAGTPALDPAVLEDVLRFYGSAYSAGVLPLTSRQYESASQTGSLFEERRAASAVMLLDAWLADPPPGSAAAPLPTRDGAGTGLARTWSWAVVTDDAELQAIAVDLVEWLSEPDFLGPWTHALGSLPPNSAALETWPSDPSTNLVRQLVNVTLPMPPRPLTDIVGPALRKAVDSVLSGALTPQTAALQASTEVAGP